jgi:hypothetical protein
MCCGSSSPTCAGTREFSRSASIAQQRVRSNARRLDRRRRREFEIASPGQARPCACSRHSTPPRPRLSKVRRRSGDRSSPGRRARRRPRCASSGRRGRCGSCAGRCRGGASSAGTGTRTTTATSCRVSNSSSACWVSGTAARWVLIMAFLLAGCRSWFARSGGCRSFSTRTVDRSLRSIVRRRHHRLRTSSGCTPLGYVVIAQVKGIPRRLSGPPCRAVSHRNVEAPHLTNARQQLERAVLEDAPPEGGGGVVIGCGSRSGRRPQ